MFGSAGGADVGGDPLVRDGEFREAGQERGEGFLCEIGEAAAVPFPLKGPVLERRVKDPAGPECGDHPAEDLRQVR